MQILQILLGRNENIKEHSEAVARRCSIKKLFLETSQNSQEKNCARVSFLKKETLAQVFSCEFCEISENTFSYRTPPVGTSEHYFLGITAVIYAWVLKFNRSSRLHMFFKIGVLKNFKNITGKHPCWSFFLIKLKA